MLLRLRNSSRIVAEFFERLNSEKSKIDILFSDDLFDDIEVLQQVRSYVVLFNKKSMCNFKSITI